MTKPDGYTKELFASCAGYDLRISVQPDADLDGTFSAWDNDMEEMIRINGWMWTFEEA